LNENKEKKLTEMIINNIKNIETEITTKKNFFKNEIIKDLNVLLNYLNILLINNDNLNFIVQSKESHQLINILFNFLIFFENFKNNLNLCISIFLLLKNLINKEENIDENNFKIILKLFKKIEIQENEKILTIILSIILQHFEKFDTVFQLEDGLRILLQILEKNQNNFNIVYNISGIIYNLSFNYFNNYLIEKENGISLFLNILDNFFDKEEILINFFGCLNNLSEFECNKKTIKENHGISKIVKTILRYGNNNDLLLECKFIIFFFVIFIY
jgi:sulfur relay (sulfurtransferase) DsrC/TusE family protein